MNPDLLYSKYILDMDHVRDVIARHHSFMKSKIAFKKDMAVKNRILVANRKSR